MVGLKQHTLQRAHLYLHRRDAHFFAVNGFQKDIEAVVNHANSHWPCWHGNLALMLASKVEDAYGVEEAVAQQRVVRAVAVLSGSR